MDTVTRQARDYEMMVILVPDMSEEDNQAALDKVRGYITAVQAEIKETLVDSPWGRRRLAYAIRHEGVDYRDGFYTLIHFSAPPTAITDIERELKLDTGVIRYLLVTHDPKAGEKITAQPEAEAAAGDQPAEDAPAAAGQTAEAPATEEAPAEDAAPATEEAAVVDETTEAAEQAPAEEETPAAEESTEAAVEETAATIDGEEEPAPADGAEGEAVTAETRES